MPIILLMGACGSDDSGGEAEPAGSVAPIEQTDVEPLQDQFAETHNSLPISPLQGHTADFDGDDHNNLSQVASAWDLGSADFGGIADSLQALGSDAEPAAGSVRSVAAAASAVATCVEGLGGDFYISSVDGQCAEVYAEFDSRSGDATNDLVALADSAD